MAMPPPTQQTRWTAEMLQDLPDDGRRYEVIDGELFVTPAPSHNHQRASAQLFKILEPFGVSVGLEVLYAPGAITFSPVREVQPDLYVFPRRPGKAPERYIDMRELLLTVEILSPSTALVDRYRKRALYQSEGVLEYWVVDVDARMIERWRPGDAEPELLRSSMNWQPIAEREALYIDLAAYFRAVHGEWD